MKCNNGCKTEQDERIEADAIHGEGGRVVAYYCRRCGWRADELGIPIETVAEKKPDAAPKRNPERCKHENRQDVRNGFGQLIARVCGLCHARFRPETCVACGKEMFVDIEERRKFPTCDAACSRVSAKARAKAKRQEEAAAEAKERAR